jgi:hypothetical protein
MPFAKKSILFDKKSHSRVYVGEIDPRNDVIGYFLLLFCFQKYAAYMLLNIGENPAIHFNYK